MNARQDLLLIGAGGMAIEYSKVLSAFGRSHRVLGRGARSARTFEEATGIAPSIGPLSDQLSSLHVKPHSAIVAVNAMFLGEVVARLADFGIDRILVEKPAALDTAEMDALQTIAETMSTEIRIGYNRRFLESVRRAREMIAEDGGALSVKFDFSEPARRIATLDKPQRELDTWFYGNSMHVVDLALHLAGDLVSVDGETAGGVVWHQRAGVFVGHGRSESGVLLSWHANWMGPGRWGLEVVTEERRLILQPLEALRVQDHSSFSEHPIELDSEFDATFKPGLARQVLAFLDGDESDMLPDVSEQARRWPMYESIRTGRSCLTEQTS